MNELYTVLIASTTFAYKPITFNINVWYTLPIEVTVGTLYLQVVILSKFPCIKGAYTLANVREIFPKELSLSLEDGILAMDHKIRGFAGEDVLLSGVESRTSSPVRIERNEQCVSEKISWASV